ncbi:MAG: OmpA family protein [Thermodesulfobacteriota bacterium]
MKRLAGVLMVMVLVFLVAPTPGALAQCKKIDGFVFLVDLSGSRSSEFDTQVGLLKKINASIPDAGYSAAMRTFYLYPHDPDRGLELPVPVGAYDKAALDRATDQLERHNGARTPLGPAMAASGGELAQMSGTKALVVFSDFKWSEGFGDPVAEARALKAKDPDLGVYVICLADAGRSVETAKAVAETGGGKYYHAGQLASDSTAFQAMLTDIFISRTGCQPLRISLHLEFDTAKADIRPIYHGQIAEAAEYLLKYPQTTAVIEGHTDSDGSDEYNAKLSRQRAESLRQYLIDQFQIDPARLKSEGYGESRPVADNGTAEGKQKNRRVDVVISGIPGQ